MQRLAARIDEKIPVQCEPIVVIPFAVDYLSEKTVLTHVDNIGFYINDYLLREEPQEPEEGVDQVGWFLGDWFIRKAMWASKASIKGYAATFKKFYGFLVEQGRVQHSDFDELKREIKDDMSQWLDNLRRYDNLPRW